MNSLKKTLAVILSLAMLAPLTSCSSEKEKATEVKLLSSKGGYAESKVEGRTYDMQSVSEFVTIGEKTGVISAWEKELVYISKDGTRVFRSEVEDLTKNDDDDIYAVYAASDNGLVICKDGDTCTINAEGECNKVTGADYIYNFEFADNGRLYGLNYNALYEVDINTGAAKKLADKGERINFFDIIGNRIFYGDRDGVHIYDIEKNGETEVPDVLADLMSKYKAEKSDADHALDICAGNNDDIYIGCEDGLYHYSWGGNFAEQIIDGLISRFGDPSDQFGTIYCAPDGTIYATFNSGMYKYVYDPEIENAVTSELKVYSLEKNSTISQIVSSFAADNRNIKVDYQVGMKEGLTYSDAMKELTTQILSGNAPDVIVIDGLDNDNLIEKNMLTDLSKYEDKWLPDDELLDNIAKWNTVDGKLYSVACKFRIPAVGAERKDLEKIKCFADAADLCEKYRKEKAPHYTILDFFDETDPIRMGLMYEGNKLLSGTPDKAAFEKFYESCAKLYNNDKSPSEMDTAFISSTDNDEAGSEYFFGTRYMAEKMNKNVIALGSLNGFENEINVVTSLMKLDNDIDAAYRYGMESDKCFIPNCNIAVSESGKNKEDAFRFIASALGEEAQEIEHSDGFPVNKAALEYFYEKNRDADNVYGLYVPPFDSNEDGEGAEVDMEWMTDDEAKEFDSYIQTLSEPVFIKYSIREMIEEAGKKCIEGTVTAEQAAEDTVKQLELRMKE